MVRVLPIAGSSVFAERLAVASKVQLQLDMDMIPLSAAYRAMRGESLDSRLQAASWGDDYQLLFTMPPETVLPVAATALGRVCDGSGLALFDMGQSVALPPLLGYQHH